MFEFLRAHTPKVFLDFLVSTGGAIMSYWTVEREGKRVLREERLRTVAPQSYDKKLRDEAQYARVKSRLAPGLQKALSDWTASLGANQREDFILSIAEMTIGQTHAEKTAAFQAAVDKLEYFARIPTDQQRLKEAVADRLIQYRREGEYPVVMAKNQIRRTARGINRSSQALRARTLTRRQTFFGRWAERLFR